MVGTETGCDECTDACGVYEDTKEYGSKGVSCDASACDAVGPLKEVILPPYPEPNA